MFNSLRPYELQSARLLCPLDFPDKNRSTSLWLCVCHVRLFVTQWTVARQAPLSKGFSRQEYWRGLLFLSPGDLPDPGIKSTSLASPALAVGFCTSWATREAQFVTSAAAKSLQSCPTLCNSIYSSPPGSPVPGILQARTLEWVAISYYYCNYSRNRIPKQESNWHKPSVFIYKWSFLKVSNLILMGTPWSVYGLIE